MKFKIEKVSNMVFITSECGVIFNAWDAEDFTERKLTNAMKKIQSDYNFGVEFARMF